MNKTNSAKNCFILVGELSGEEHARSFLPQLIKDFPEIEFWGAGGEEMRYQGVKLQYHLSQLSTMGFTEVIKKIFFYKNVRRKLLQEIKNKKTPIAILVDFQGLNMSLLKPLHEMGVKVLYFVAPQAWAWKSWRSESLRKYVSQLYCILPFEEQWFRNKGVAQAVSVAHPVYLSQLSKQIVRSESVTPHILWLPGSRRGEVAQHMPVFLQSYKILKNQFPQLECSIVCSPAFAESGWGNYLERSWIQYTPEQLSIALSKATVAVAASGTVTLSCALMEVPTIVCYRVSLINAWIMRKIIRYTGFVSLPNLLLNEKVFPELLQDDFHPVVLSNAVELLLNDPNKRAQVSLKLSELKKQQEFLESSAYKYMASFFHQVYR